MKYPYRYLARIIIEANTPIAVGSGEESVITDRLIATDVNGFPYIPGTSLAGILRHSLTTDKNNKQIDDIFGCQGKEDGTGSRLILSSAMILNNNGKVIDGLYDKDPSSDEFLKHFFDLPVRQHVRINHKGASEKGNKFDEQVVFKGTRFCFEMELIGEPGDKEAWESIISSFSDPDFRIGGGTRRGFGEIKVKECRTEIIDLNKQLPRYLSKSSFLTDESRWWKNVTTKTEIRESIWEKYELKLKPENFLMFGSGFGTDEADMSYITESIIEWKDNNAEFGKRKLLIPAASVKGTIAHRTAYYFNKINKIYADKISSDDIGLLIEKGYRIPESCKTYDSKKKDDIIKMILEGNPAVRNLFGYTDDNKEGKAHRGNVLLSDMFIEDEGKKLFNHVSIDRFTGGAINGALFGEDVAKSTDTLTLCLFVNPIAFNREDVRESFEKTLIDICNGMLPLGGGTMRGHGCFKGILYKNGKEISHGE